MMQPKRMKYRKPHRTRYEGKAKGNKFVAFGEYGLLVMSGKGRNCNGRQKTGNWITDKQLEAARVVLAKTQTKYLKQRAKIWIRIFPQLSRTKKPLEVRMGSGKGNPEIQCAVAKAGTVIFEIANVPEAEAKDTLRKAGNKLNVVCRVVSKADLPNETVAEQLLKKTFKAPNVILRR
ncbi:MAG: 50S ribosomal protein L16 [Mycoplasmataceae bacterium]|nr:50S ribosomal protein L16 [Mycoplasmataceae bacterium]